MDCLESLGFVERQDGGDAIEDTRYRSREPLAAVVDAALGTERDRDRHPWRDLGGRLAEVLRGGTGLAAERFTWPPSTEAQLADFEASMAAGCGPIAETFVALGPAIAGDGRPLRVLDVGGGDGTLAARMLDAHPHLSIDVFNLPAAESLVKGKAARASASSWWTSSGRAPEGYDAWVRPRAPRLGFRRGPRASSQGPRALLLVAGSSSEEIRTGREVVGAVLLESLPHRFVFVVSRLRDLSFYEEALGTLGFREITVAPGVFDVVTATV